MNKFLLLIALFLIQISAFASENMHHAETDWVKSVILPFINFAMLIALFYFLLSKKVVLAVKERKENFQKQLTGLKATNLTNSSVISDLKNKLSGIDGEVDKIIKNQLEIAKEQSEQIISNAAEKAKKILDDTQLLLNTEIKREVDALKFDLLESAILDSESLIKGMYGTEDNNKRIGNFLNVKEKITC